MEEELIYTSQYKYKTLQRLLQRYNVSLGRSKHFLTEALELKPDCSYNEFIIRLIQQSCVHFNPISQMSLAQLK